MPQTFQIHWRYIDTPSWVPVPNMWVAHNVTSEADAIEQAKQHAAKRRPGTPVEIVKVTCTTPVKPIPLSAELAAQFQATMRGQSREQRELLLSFARVVLLPDCIEFDKKGGDGLSLREKMTITYYQEMTPETRAVLRGVINAFNPKINLSE